MSMARLNDRRVFSGACRGAPRWPTIWYIKKARLPRLKIFRKIKP
jgi:hypothetical protein